jgi:threonine synthase
MEPINAQTVADSISADLPRDRVKAVRAVRETKGAFVSVHDQDILDGIPVLARLSGVFAEPAASATYAGVKAALAEGHIRPDEHVVLVVTGNGLKDIRSAMRVAGAGYPVAPSMDEVEKARRELGLPTFK